MAADYAQIRADNARRYGWDTAVLDLLGHLYSERTHFLFELIQNAEDATATELSFELFEDRLEVTHDGRPFTPEDVRRICGVAGSGKSGDLTTIGTFGIGFKSVFAYTATPRVHSAEEHFRLENFVRPFPVPPVAAAAGTLFSFPFDHAAVDAGTAVAEISAALRQLDAGTLLFLRSIERVRIRGARLTGSVLKRAAAPRTSSSRHVTVTNGSDSGSSDSSGRGRGSQEWLVWHRELGGAGLPGQRVEIAFRAVTTAGRPRLVPLDTSPLVVFFPTAKETFLGFLVQGPYRTTPARDNIPADDPSNQVLARETAALLADVLPELRDDGLLTADVLAAMPLDATRFPPEAMLRPLYDAVRAALGQQELIPLAGGGYGAAAAVRLAADGAVAGLLTPGQLGALYAAGQPAAFAADSITENQAPALWRYLRAEIGVEAVTAAGVAGRLTGEFLAAQSDAWITRCYRFLHADRALWQPPGSAAGPAGPARARPIIRLEDGSQVTPFDADGRPAAYLPGPGRTSLPAVRRAIAAVPAARQFLAALGLTEPDAVAEVLDAVLVRYAALDADTGAADLNRAQHSADVECVARALEEAPAGRRGQLLDALARTAFLLGENAATGQQRLMRPAQLYQRTRSLETYLAGNPDAWFAADEYGPWLAQLRGMGVRADVRPQRREADDLGHVPVVAQFARHERGLDGFDPGAQIDGLQFALSQPGHARSEYVWNALLVPHRGLVAGVVEKSVHQDFTDAGRETVRSAIGTAAAAAAWLPAPGGSFRRPAELTPEDLPATYQRDDMLAKSLGMSQSVLAEASRQLGLPPEILPGLRDNPDLVAKLRLELAARAAAAREL